MCMYEYICNLRPCYIASIDSLTHISDADDALDARKLCVNLAPGFACHPPQAPRPVSRFKENLCLAKKGKRKWGDRPVLDGPNMRLNLSTHTHTHTHTENCCRHLRNLRHRLPLHSARRLRATLG